ncbi:hypothetical protein BDW59DRAFT_168173 [Aspergillus cavernicola]|uniref:Cupredoxin n=1 Tax=Aspergillus cavernicola TaxID=176166 RepID=A0ABR4H3U1_9EURO
MSNPIIALILMLPLVLAQSMPNVLTPTASAIAGHQTFHVKVGDGQPRFQPSRLSVNVGDSISFQVQGLSCTLQSSHRCGSSKSPVEDEKQFVLRDTGPQIFFCDSADDNSCSSDLFFALNVPWLPSPTPGLNRTAEAGSSRIVSSSHVESSSMISSAPISTSPYNSHFNQHSTEAPYLPSSVPGTGAGTTTVHAPATFPSQGPQFESAAGTVQIIGVNLACVLIAIFSIINIL